MYFDIVLVYYHQREKRDPPRDQQQDNNRGDGGTSHAALIARYDRPVMGLPCWPLFFCFFFPVGFVFGGLLPLGPLFLFFNLGGRETQGRCDQSITKLMNI